MSTTLLNLIMVSAVLAAPPAAKKAGGGLIKGPAVLPGFRVPYPDPPGIGGPDGRCEALIDIDEMGSVKRIEIQQCSEPVFAAQLLDHGPNYRFSPGATAEGPVPVRIRWEEVFVAPEPPKPKVQQIRLLGRVREAGTGVVLPGIEVTVAGQRQETDEKGKFEFRGTGNGSHTLVFSADGYHAKKQTIMLAPKEQVELNVYLRPTAANRFVAVVKKRKEEPSIVRRTLHAEELARVPGTMGDPIRAVERLPGVARAPFFGGALIVRGGQTEDTGVHIDGFQVPLLFHFGGGPSIIHPDLVEQIDFLPGGFSSEYGRAIAGIIDVKTRRADGSRFGGKIDIDLLDSGLRLEGPVDGRGHWAAAFTARRSYIDQLLPFALDAVGAGSEVRVQPVYWDYQARLDYVKPGSPRRGGVRLYGSDDVFRLVSADEEAARREGRPPGVGIHTRFHHLIGDYEQRLGRATRLLADMKLGTTRTGGDIGDIRWDLGFLAAALRGQLRHRFHKGLEVTTGIAIEDQYWTSDARIPVNSTLERRFPGSDLGDDFALTEITENGNGLGVDGYFTLHWKPDGEIDLFPGLRLHTSHWGNQSRVALEPRLSLQVKLDPEGRHRLKFQSGHYTRMPQPQEVSNTLGDPDLELVKAWQYGIGYEIEIDPYLTTDLQLYYRRMWDGITNNRNYVNGGSEPRIHNEGWGRAYGMELMVRANPGPKPYYGWIAYTLNRSELYDGDRPEDGWTLFGLDQTHILNTVLGYKFGFGWVTGLTIRLVSGTPTTTLEGARFDVDTGGYRAFRSELNDSRTPPFFQIDWRIEKRIARARTAWVWYLDVMNLTNHENTEFYIYQYDYRARSSLPGLPFFPSFGVEYTW
ncbi:MAG TPA: hypothetical protein DEB46_06595 [Myxococcales bacterium]|nr:hypothetical protein [Myxococcales bacterium]